MPAPLLQATGLRKRYGAREVVQGLDLELVPGEILALLGPNGAGKSTTVGMLCGLVRPDAGALRLRGEPVAPGADTLQRTIGLVPQDLALYELLPARVNLETFGRLQGLSGATLARRVDAALAVAGLADRARDVVATFSGGMKRRLNIASALLHEPAVLILDEPTVGIDPQSRNAIFDTLEQLRDAGHALLYSTHYMEEAERLCRRALIVDHGRCLAQGTLADLLAGMTVQAEVTLRLATPAGVAALDALRADAAVDTLSIDGDALRLGLHDLQALPDALARARELGLAWRELHTQRASLESLFLQLTGRDLRD